MRRGGSFVLQQLTFSQSAGAQETVERLRRDLSLWLVTAAHRQLVQQGRTGTMRIFAFEPFDEGCGWIVNGAQLPAIVARFGSEGGEPIAAIGKRPLQ